MGREFGRELGAKDGLRDIGVVTCLAAQSTSVSPTGPLAAALEHAGAAVVLDAGNGLVAAFRRVTDAVRAAVAVRDTLPADTRIALCAGETRGGEFGSIADKAALLAEDAEPGSTVLSKLTATLAIDHLPRHQTLCERRRGTGRLELSYELLEAMPQPA